jgi:putative salt-induced outer membrane protein YdiY
MEVVLRAGTAWIVIGGVALAAAPTMAQDDQVPAEEAPDDAMSEAMEASFWEGWETSVEAGLNGSTGNTERFNVRAGLSTERLTTRMESRGSLTYTLGTEEGGTTENKFVAQARNDWLVPDSRWRYYARGSAEYDEFQEWDWLVAADGGAGYEFIDDDEFLLIGRAGAGVSQKLGGDVDDRFRVEAVLGADFEWQIDERQKLFVTADYYPALNLWPKYRITSTGGYEVLVDPELQLSLKLGYDFKYDSSPGLDRKRADLDYFAVVVWTF